MNRLYTPSKIKKLLRSIVSHDLFHAKWLNTLSFLENCGARKIAACEHPTQVKEEMLKHAAEEFRHAHYLKKQIQRVYPTPMPTYTLSSMLGNTATLHYLNGLDLKACRYLKAQSLSPRSIREMAYLLVTYAIELRAAELYPLYHEVLREINSPVTVKSILLEEEQHLNEMKQGLHSFPSGFIYAKQICTIEQILCKVWLDSIEKNLYDYLYE